MKDKIKWLAFKINGNKSGSTASISRNHVIEVSDSGLITLMGGKWTSFRQMGEETVDTIVKTFEKKLEPKYENSQTLNFNYIGSYAKSELSYGIKRPIDVVAQ